MKNNLTNLVDELIKNAQPISNEYDYDEQRYDWLEDSIRTLYIDYCMCLLKMDCRSLIFCKEDDLSSYILDIYNTLLKTLNHEGILTTFDLYLIKHIDLYFIGFYDFMSKKYG